MTKQLGGNWSESWGQPITNTNTELGGWKSYCLPLFWGTEQSLILVKNFCFALGELNSEALEHEEVLIPATGGYHLDRILLLSM